MARQCVADMLLCLLEQDPRFRDLPGAVCITWLRLVRLMQAMGQNALVYGDEIPSDETVAVSVTLSGAEFGTHLLPLLRRGLLNRRADGALESPHLKPASSKHATAARNNGLKGGRKPAAADSNVLEGHFGGAERTQAEPTGSPPHVRAGLAKLEAKLEAKLSSPAQGEAAVPDDWPRIGQAAFDQAGLDPAASPATYGCVRQWLARGASEALILDTIHRVRGRMRQPPRHLGYFEPAVMEALAMAPVASQQMPADPAYSAAIAAYNVAWDAWFDGGRCGPGPVLPVRRSA